MSGERVTEREPRRGRGAKSPRPSKARVARDNQLLGTLSPVVRACLEPHLRPVRLAKREVLFRAHEPLRVVYFPNDAVISFVSRLESGQTLDVGLVGRDGLAGTALFPGITTMSCDGIVQIPGLAQQISAEVLRRELLTSESLSLAIARYAHVLLMRSMQMSLCNMFHSVEQRCVRRLLAVSDLVDSDEIPLTHDVIATMLGVRRPTVTLVLGSLRKAGLVREGRGRIFIRDRQKLEAACCECYGVMQNEQRRLMGGGISFERAISR